MILNLKILFVSCQMCLFILISGIVFICRWFEKLNDHFEVSGRGGLMYKPQGKNQTDLDADHALALLKKGIKCEHYTFIYHCERHYFCPLGYEDVPVKPTDAYR